MTCGWCAHDVCHPYIISSTLYIFYHVQLSFCTLSTQMHIVHVICMWSAHVQIICLSSLTLLVYPIIHNLVSAHFLHTHTHIVYVISILSTNAYIMYISFLLLLFTYGWHRHCLLGRKISRTTANNVCIICICPDNVWMTCTYADNMWTMSRCDMQKKPSIQIMSQIIYMILKWNNLTLLWQIPFNNQFLSE